MTQAEPRVEPSWLREVGPEGAQLLSEASVLAGASQDEPNLLRDLMDLCLRHLADWVVLYLADEVGTLRRAHAATSHAQGEAAIRGFLAHATNQPLPSIVQQVAASGRGRLVPDVGAALAEDGHHRAFLRRLGEGHGMLAPLHARGRVIGVLALASGRRPSSPGHVALAEALGRQMGLAVDNARLLAREQRARREAEAAVQRMARLQGVTAALSEALTAADVGRIAVDDVARAAGAYGASMWLLSGDGAWLDVVAHRGLPGAQPPRERLDAPLPLQEALRSRHAYYLEDAGAAARRYRELVPVNARTGQKALACLPFVINGRGVGGLCLSWHEPRPFPHEERAFLEALARQVAQAIERARLFESEQRARGEAESAAAQLRASEARYRLIAENTLDMISRLLPDGTALYVSPACRRLLGFEPEELVGRRVETFIHPEDRLPEGVLPRDLLGAGNTYTRTYRRERKDGSWVWFEMTGHGVRDPQTGELREIVTVSRDITERRLAEEELDQSRRQVAQSEKLSALGSLVSGVAHEIRTPLAYITNHVYLIQQRLERAVREGETDLLPALEEARLWGQEAIEGTDRINALVKDLSRFIRQTSGPRTPAPLHEVVAEAVRLFQATHKGEVDLLADLQPTPPVSLDRVQVQQVVLNLLENAFDADPLRGSARVRTRSAPGGAELVVEDDGPGIPPEIQARMYDPFFTTKPEGTGLGLSIVRRIAETHGATLRCVSGPGEGTCFTIAFPAAQPPAEQATPAWRKG